MKGSSLLSLCLENNHSDVMVIQNEIFLRTKFEKSACHGDLLAVFIDMFELEVKNGLEMEGNLIQMKKAGFLVEKVSKIQKCTEITRKFLKIPEKSRKFLKNPEKLMEIEFHMVNFYNPFFEHFHSSNCSETLQTGLFLFTVQYFSTFTS